MYNIVLDGHVEAGGILLLGGGINPLMIVLICYIGLNLLIAVTIYLYQHYMTSSIREHP